MAAAVLGEARQLLGAASDGYGHCCPPVFDPYTLVALIGGIALATYFLRIVIVTSTIGGRSIFEPLFSLGKFLTRCHEALVFQPRN